MKLPRWAWLTWIGLGVVMEAIGLATKAPGDTLTEVTVATFPAWLIVGLCTWAVAHFKARYDERH